MIPMNVVPRFACALCAEAACALCAEAAARAASEPGVVYVCDDCGRVHGAAAPAPGERPSSVALSPARRERVEPADRAIENLLRWLPDLSPRSGPLVRDGVRVATSAVALDGRVDRLDGRSSEVARAVVTWRRLRAMVATGDGMHAAILWAAHAGVVVLHQADGHRVGGTAQRERVTAAVACGCASPTQRHDWRRLAAQRPERYAYTSELYPRLHCPVPTADEDDSPAPASAFTTEGVQDRPRRILHIEQRGAHGPAMEASAAAWGAERLADLWAPAPVDPACARGFALGFARVEERARWELMKIPGLRAAEVSARGEALLRAAEERWARDDRVAP